ncbi:DUF6083 domain-containing protein [Streptomyces sp. NPDC056374]|uniref:DUF6083 domain-containing protein n=1 Tax=unclassified Streptomyces TaxID=2593676 RepID=UPI0035E1EAF0
MRTIHSSSSHHWDGSPITPGRRRALRVAADSPTRLLRTAQHGECRDCGNQVAWHTTITQRAIPFHPAELPTVIVPEPHRWHVASGVAHHADDGTPWCRITHLTLCPAHTAPQALPPALDTLRQRLALRTRRLLDTGAFTPGGQSAVEPPAEDACRPSCPVVQFLYSRYIAARPVEDIQCVAQTVRRTRCPHPVLAPGTTPGRWTLTPATPHRTSRQLSLLAIDIALYDLGHLPYSEQLRWRTQRCPAHAAAHAAPDLALAEWEPFDPLRHHAFLATRLPGSSQHR